MVLMRCLSLSLSLSEMIPGRRARDRRDLPVEPKSGRAAVVIKAPGICASVLMTLNDYESVRPQSVWKVDIWLNPALMS